MRHKGFSWLEVIFIFMVLTVPVAFFVYPVIQQSNQGVAQASCQSNLRRIGFGFAQYKQDYNGKFPRVIANAVSTSTTPFKTPYGWADAISPYVKTTALFQCPGERNTTPGTDGTQTGFTDYWMNLNLSGELEKNLSSPAMTFLCGDGNDGTDGTDARYARNVLPQSWISNNNSPAYRHRNVVMNILYVDGHVKSAKARFLSAKRERSGDFNGQYSFDIK